MLPYLSDYKFLFIPIFRSNHALRKWMSIEWGQMREGRPRFNPSQALQRHTLTCDIWMETEGEHRIQDKCASSLLNIHWKKIKKFRKSQIVLFPFPSQTSIFSIKESNQGIIKRRYAFYTVTVWYMKMKKLIELLLFCDSLISVCREKIVRFKKIASNIIKGKFQLL